MLAFVDLVDFVDADLVTRILGCWMPGDSSCKRILSAKVSGGASAAKMMYAKARRRTLYRRGVLLGR